jgi:hypothetical protein
MQQKKDPQQKKVASGPCPVCRREHSLHEGNARIHGLELMQFLEQEKRIDLPAKNGLADPQLSTDALFSEARGKMFGVMVCRAVDGSERVLRAFSGQYNGIWEVEGWAPPIFNVETFTRIYADIEPRIKDLGRSLQLTNHSSLLKNNLTRQRRQLSQQWMRDIHALYTLANFRGERRPLTEVFTGNGGIPTGTGDCCAPKLLNQAINEQLLPLGLAEFYWGRENASQTRHHGHFYPSCTSKCMPILGFILCGLDELLIHQDR